MNHHARALLLSLAVLRALPALAQPADQALAARMKALDAHCEAFDQESERAGVTMEGTIYHLADRTRPPPATAITALDEKLKTLTREAATLRLDCEKSDTLRSECIEATERVDEMNAQWKVFDHELRPAQEASRRAADLESLYLKPVSGSPKDRAIELPRAFRRENGRRDVVVDGAALFAAVHPSHFLFLRRNLSAAPRDSLQYNPVRFSRTLKKGEAVLTLRRSNVGDREVELLSLDGNRGMVSVDDLAQAPLPGARVAALTAADLNVFDDKGNVIAGPTWLEPDDTGFALDEPNAWLDLLEPQEPRASKFLEAKDKALSCYQKQRAKLDPRGTLSKHFDIVTFGRNGSIQKVEPAAARFDRTACAACGCKAFNAQKAAAIKAAIEPAQKQAFTKYQPVVEQLLKTDFAAASKGAPKGSGAEDENQPL